MDARAVNRMIELRVKDLAGRLPTGSVDERRATLRKCLGLEPLPPRSDLNPRLTGTVQRDGYRIEKFRYDSTPSFPVMAQLYLPEGEARHPLILRPYDHWEAGKCAPVVQAGAVSFALQGFACLVIESPGVAGNLANDNELNERRVAGPHKDPFLAMGAPAQGRYVWDMIRALDCLQGRSDIDQTRIGVTGEGVAADTAMYAFALDERITVTVAVAGVESRESNPTGGCECRIVPGVMALGDRADILALRAPHAALMVLAAEDDQEFPTEGHVRTDEKLRRAYRSRHGEGRYRFERFFGGHDYNRRMREAALAFFTEHLCGGPASPCCPEARPLTDGALNPYPSGTVDPACPELEVSPPWDRQSLTFRELLDETLTAPLPEFFRIDQRLVTWRKYGQIPAIRPGAIFAIHDSTVASSNEPGSMPLPESEIDLRLCTLLGLSVAEALAQILHVFLPGGPETWESSGTGLSNDPFTSMIASMKTLVTTPEAPPKMVVAEGPVAGMVARFLARYRPSLEIQATHPWTSWREALDQNIPQNAQPLARYLEWI